MRKIKTTKCIIKTAVNIENYSSLQNSVILNYRKQLLDIVFEALTESEVLIDCIVVKAARILNKKLDSYSRKSLDIDANILAEFVEQHSSLSVLSLYNLMRFTRH